MMTYHYITAWSSLVKSSSNDLVPFMVPDFSVISQHCTIIVVKLVQLAADVDVW